jgi:hypothetical protein
MKRSFNFPTAVQRTTMKTYNAVTRFCLLLDERAQNYERSTERTREYMKWTRKAVSIEKKRCFGVFRQKFF